MAHQIERKLNSGNERKKLTTMVIDTKCNWESFLIPAPISIAILGQLVAIASKTDFSLKENPPENGFEFVKIPTSFRASLVQLGNSGCSAFITAHKNMEKIKLYTVQFQENVQDAVRILLKGSVNEKSSLLPFFFSDMKKDSNACLSLAWETEQQFTKVMDLVDEIAESSAAVKGVYEDKFKQAMAKMKVLKEREKQIEDRIKEMEREKLENIRKTAEIESKLEKCYEEVPGAGMIFGLTFCESGMKVISGAANIFSLSKLSKTASAVVSLKHLIKHSKETNVNETNATDEKKPNKENTGSKDSQMKKRKGLELAYLHADEILKATEMIYNFFEKVAKQQIENTDAADKDNSSTDENQTCKGEQRSYHYTVQLDQMDEIEGIKAQLELFIGDYKGSDYREDTHVIQANAMCKKITSLCDELKTMSKSFNEVSCDGLFARVQKLHDEAKDIQMKACSFHGSNPMPLPIEPAEGMQTTHKKPSIIEFINENARYKVEERKKQLEDIKQERLRFDEEIKEMQQKQDSVLESLSKVDIEKVNFEEIQKTLKEGIIALSELKTQWALLVLFFTKITNTLDVCLYQKTLRMDEKLDALKYRVEETSKKMVLEMASSVNAFVYSIGLIAATYTEISEKHIVGNTAALSKLLAFDPTTETNELDKERKKLLYNCEQAKTEIRALTAERRKMAMHEIETSFERLQSEIEDKLPPIQPERLQMIKETVANMDKDDDATEADYL